MVTTEQVRARLSWFFVGVVLLISADILIFGSDKPLLIASSLLVGFSLYQYAWELVPSAFLIFCLFVVSRFYPEMVWRFPTAPFLIPLILLAICCYPFSRLRREFGWIRKGEVDQVSTFLVILVSLSSALALILWALWTNYLGVATQMLSQLHSLPRWFSLFVVVPGFALLNAFAEEAIFRGVLMDGLEKRFPSKYWLVLTLQASAFAAVHFSGGFPNGKIGYLMTFIYACMLGHLKKRTGGMLAPYVAHVTADLVIGITLVLLAS